jgi:hypothetical protein
VGVCSGVVVLWWLNSSGRKHRGHNSDGRKLQHGMFRSKTAHAAGSVAAGGRAPQEGAGGGGLRPQLAAKVV